MTTPFLNDVATSTLLFALHFKLPLFVFQDSKNQHFLLLMRSWVVCLDLSKAANLFHPVESLFLVFDEFFFCLLHIFLLITLIVFVFPSIVDIIKHHPTLIRKFVSFQILVILQHHTHFLTCLFIMTFLDCQMLSTFILEYFLMVKMIQC